MVTTARTAALVVATLLPTTHCTVAKKEPPAASVEESPGRFRESAEAINGLGIDLLRALPNTNENAVISPFSIQEVLAMAYAGASGQTQLEMFNTLHYPKNEDSLHSSFAALAKSLADLSQRSVEMRGESAKDSDRIVIAIANRLYAQEGRPFRRPFLELLESNYLAPPVRVDFHTRAEPTRKEINAWVAELTRQRIRNLIPEGGVSPNTALVLANAVYLKAPWKKKFDEAATGPAPFAVAGGENANTATMFVSSYFGYSKDKDFEVVTIPYSNPEIRFVVLLPSKESSIAGVLATLTSAQLRGLGQAPVIRVRLHMPKFQIAPPTITLSQALSTLGMKAAFKPDEADFSRIDWGHELSISEIFHKAFIQVDERGTEAAAASALAMQNVSAAKRESPPIEVHVDRPFLFAVQHRSSGACLFLGWVTDPR